jgi:hypothetical protein
MDIKSKWPDIKMEEILKGLVVKNEKNSQISIYWVGLIINKQIKLIFSEI